MSTSRATSKQTQTAPTRAPAISLLQRKCACGQHTIAGGECDDCNKNRQTIQRSPRNSEFGTRNSAGVPAIVNEVLRSSGRALDTSTRAFFESRFRHDFSRVRVHTDAKAVQSAQAVNALAYTDGRNPGFGAGQYVPGTSAYRQLVAHELTHVIQQGGRSEHSSLSIGKADDSHERKADAVAQNMISRPVGRQTRLTVGSSVSHLQRQVESHNKTGSSSQLELEAEAQEGDMPGSEAGNGIELTEEESKLIEEAVAAMGGGSLESEVEALAPLQPENAAQENDPAEGKQTGPGTAKRRRKPRKGHFVGSRLIRLLCGQSARYFRHRDLLSCLKSKRKRSQETELGHKPPPEDKDNPPPHKEEPPPKVDCPEDRKANILTACIQPMVIADDDGKNPTTAPSFAQVTAIWGKCCINYSIKATKTINKTAYKTLDESPNAVPTGEERDLFKDAGASDCIQVFVPQTFAQGGRISKQISGGGGTYDGGAANPKIVVVEGGVAEVVAHEVGHASGDGVHDDNDTVMKPTGAYDTPNSTAVSADVCRLARMGSVLKKAGDAKSCCMTLE